MNSSPFQETVQTSKLTLITDQLSLNERVSYLESTFMSNQGCFSVEPDFQHTPVHTGRL
jgi:hypothetical protein